MRTQGTCLHIEVRPKLNPALAVGLSLVSCHDSPRFPVNCHRNVVAVRKTASHRPSTMIKLCRDLGVPHSGRRAQLANHLRIGRPCRNHHRSRHRDHSDDDGTGVCYKLATRVFAVADSSLHRPHPTLATQRYSLATPDLGSSTRSRSLFRLMLVLPCSQMFLHRPCKFPLLEPRPHLRRPPKLNLVELSAQPHFH